LYECELASLQETLRPMVGEMDPVPYVAEIEAYWAAPPIHADAVRLLEALDIPVCCVSNADTEALLSAIAGNGLRFTQVVSSQSVRCYKPEPEIFRQAVKRLGVEVDRVLHVGDSKHSDIGGATKVGITTAWLCRDDRIHDIGTCDSHYTIRSLTE
jgi:2-haloacid dehalogenase/putative hydrolase of the HAD superfamily